MKVVYKTILDKIDEELASGEKGDIIRIEVSLTTFQSLYGELRNEHFPHVSREYIRSGPNLSGSYLVYKDVCVQTHSSYAKDFRVVRQTVLSKIDAVISKDEGDIKEIILTQDEFSSFRSLLLERSKGNLSSNPDITSWRLFRFQEVEAQWGGYITYRDVKICKE